jgi:D-aminopeptidase
MSQRANTTIAIIATDATLTKAECQRVAVAAHDGIGRATVPAHTPMDGDLVFSLTTAGKPAGEVSLIGHAASLCLARAIARAIYEATPNTDDLLPCWRTLNA